MARRFFAAKAPALSCHSINGDGGRRRARSREYRRPRAARPTCANRWSTPGRRSRTDYLLVTAVTSNGETVTGHARQRRFVLDPDPRQRRRPHSFWKEDMEEIDRQRGKSPMPSYKDSSRMTELTDLMAYLASLKESEMRILLLLFAPAALLAQVNVPFERIRDADKEPGNWLTYSRRLLGPALLPARSDPHRQRGASCAWRGCIRRTSSTLSRRRRSLWTERCSSPSRRMS